MIDPPSTVGELERRAASLAGRRVVDLAAMLGLPPPLVGVHGKGTVGALVERALGATGGSAARHDFPELGVELKTIPIGARGVPRESTYVCTLPLDGIENATWETSWVRKKLSCVLWVPFRVPELVFDAPRLWIMSPSEDAELRHDFDDLVGTIAIGNLEGLTAHKGKWLQVRPKAKDGTKTERLAGVDGEWIHAVKKGFYLRAAFTKELLAKGRMA